MTKQQLLDRSVSSRFVQYFVQECCELGATEWEYNTALYASFFNWCRFGGLVEALRAEDRLGDMPYGKPVSHRHFTQHLLRLSYEWRWNLVRDAAPTQDRKRIWIGICLAGNEGRPSPYKSVLKMEALLALEKAGLSVPVAKFAKAPEAPKAPEKPLAKRRRMIRESQKLQKLNKILGLQQELTAPEKQDFVWE